MRLLFLLILLFSFVKIWTQEDTPDIYEVEDVIIEKSVLEVVEQINWCHEATPPIWVECDNDSIGDLNACTKDRILQFVQENLIYPKGLGCAQGKVYVSFVINKEGYVDNITLLKGFHDSLDSVAIQVIEKLPRFIPASQRNRPIAVKYNLPIRFEVY